MISARMSVGMLSIMAPSNRSRLSRCCMRRAGSSGGVGSAVRNSLALSAAAAALTEMSQD